MEHLTMQNFSDVKSKHLFPGDSRTFFVIFAIGFALLFAVALLGQVLGLHWRSWLPGAENMKSLTAGVESGVYTFMSHIL
jgi:light-harvesting complex 1 beta chain